MSTPTNERRPTGSRLDARLLASVAAATSTLALAACGSAQRAFAPALSAPLATTIQVGTATWATIPMGAVSGVNRFWELFLRSSATAGWALTTPPGVADNGGLALDASSHTLTVGFLPSQNLIFSPIATTGDRGRTWAPDVLPTGLVPTPDSLATSAQATTVALVARAHGTLLLRAHTGGSWTTLASARTIAARAPARRCDLAKLTAVAFGAAGTLLAGGACTNTGEVPIFARVGDRWLSTGPTLTRTLAERRVSVLALTRAGTTLFTLLDLSGDTNSLVAAWSTNGGRQWAQTAPLPLRRGARLLAWGLTSDATAYVLTTPARISLKVASPNTRAWQALPTPPSGTVAVALAAAGDDALAAHGSMLSSWRLAPGTRVWRKRASEKIPIQYGSSS